MMTEVSECQILVNDKFFIFKKTRPSISEMIRNSDCWSDSAFFSLKRRGVPTFLIKKKRGEERSQMEIIGDAFADVTSRKNP